MTTRRIARIITGFILLLVAAVIGGSFYMLAFSLRPDARMREKNATAYEYMYAEYPFLRPWVDSLQTAGALRDTVIADPQGVRLHALYAAAPVPTDRTAVIVHGYTDCAVRMLMIGYLYNHDLGYNILLPDLYYHGQSEGRAIRMGWLDRFDLLRWMEIADGIFGGDTRMVVHGISMGAATTMMASGEPQRPYVRCFVEDCGYTGVWDEFSKELKSSFGLPAFPLLYTASWLCDLKYGWNFREASSLAQVAKCRLPMLFIHGDADDYVPTWMVRPLFEAKPGDKELWLVPGAGHAASYRDNREEYTRRRRLCEGRRPEGAPQAIRRMRPRSRPAVYEIRPLGVFFCGHHRAGAGLRGRVSPVPLPAGRRRVRGLSGPLRMLPPEHPLCHGGAVARQGHPGGRARDRVVGRQRMPLPDHCRVAHCGAWLLQAASGARALGAGMVAAQNKKSRSQCFGIF